MLRMVNKKIKYLCMFAVMKTLVFGGVQNVNVGLNLTFPGAQQKIIGGQLVIDLGYLEEGKSYQGGDRINVGTVSVVITQTKTDDISGCLLEDITLDSVNLQKLNVYGARISSVDKIYVGGTSSGMTLSEGNIRNIVAEGDVALGASEEVFFVDPSCLTEGLLGGQALTKLSYDFDIYAEIPTVSKGSVVGAFAQDSAGVQLSVKDLIINQIQSTVTAGASSLKRRVK